MSISWDQALAWRMARHRLAERAAPADLVRVAGEICGLHAQVMSSAELSLWARIEGMGREALGEALWERRALVKLWAMRGTLHLLPSDEMGVWLAALGTIANRGMTGHPEIDALTEAVARALADRSLSREELALSVERMTGSAELAGFVRFSWGSYLKPAAFRGKLCFAASEGGRVVFTTPSAWVGREIEKPDAEAGLREVALRYLAAYAPATAEDLALWWGGFGPARGRRVLAALDEEAVEVDVEGRRAWVLAGDLPAMEAAIMPRVARLLPAFDPWVVAAPRRTAAFIEPELAPRVYRPQGWFSPVLLVNGRMAGVWRHTARGRRLTVELAPFGRLPAWARSQLEAEAARLAAFLQGDLSVEWAG